MQNAARWLVVLLGAAAAALAAVTIAGQASAGRQPWDPLLSDNLVFAKTVPFTLALGVALGLVAGARALARWIFVIGLALAMPTGLWQYLGGILSQDKPVPGGQQLLDLGDSVPLYLYYRIHYIGGTLLLLAAGAFASAWWAGERRVWLPRGWRPADAGGPLLRALRRAVLDHLGFGNRTTPPTEPTELSYYRSLIAFPAWELTLGLLVVTGLIKALRYVFPVPGLVLFLASTLHVAGLVLVLVLLLDWLRIHASRWRTPARPVLLVAVILWALVNLAIGYFFVVSAFVAKTGLKEAPSEPAALLLGGLTVTTLAVLLIWRSSRPLATG